MQLAVARGCCDTAQPWTLTKHPHHKTSTHTFGSGHGRARPSSSHAAERTRAWYWGHSLCPANRQQAITDVSTGACTQCARLCVALSMGDRQPSALHAVVEATLCFEPLRQRALFTSESSRYGTHAPRLQGMGRARVQVKAPTHASLGLRGCLRAGRRARALSRAGRIASWLIP